MALEKKDLEAIQVLMREENRTLEEKLNRRFDQVLTNFDILLSKDEKQQQKRLVRDEQTNRLEARVETVEKRVKDLETKVA